MGTPYAEVIGDPIVHSKSPLIHRYWLREMKLEGGYRALRIRPGGLSAYIDRRRADPDWLGCNITMPHKQAALVLADDAEAPARRIGAANTLYRSDGGIKAANTDWRAVNTLLGGIGISHAVVMGTGGAARAVLEEMRQRNVAQVDLISRSEGKGRALLREMGLTGNVLPPGAAPEGDLLVNASPSGMDGFPEMPVPLNRLSGSALVFDMVYGQAETELLKGAKAMGLKRIDGFAMLIEQAALAFACFFGVLPPRDSFPELRELLAR